LFVVGFVLLDYGGFADKQGSYDLPILLRIFQVIAVFSAGFGICHL